MNITQRTKRAAPPPHAELFSRIITAVVEDGSWASLLPLPIDGLVLVDSRSTEYASHEVRCRGRYVLSCTGPCGMHPGCFHRVKAAIAQWQHEHPGWDISQVSWASGRLHPGLIRTLITEYLTPPKHGRRWQLDEGDAAEHERPVEATA